MKCLQYKQCSIVLVHENQEVELADLFSLDKLNEAENKGHDSKFRLPRVLQG
jgi:hypothetical protein